MSQLRLGIKPDGTRHVVELGPAYARRAGWGGSALGHFSQTVLTHAQRKAAGKADAEAAKRHRRST